MSRTRKLWLPIDLMAGLVTAAERSAGIPKMSNLDARGPVILKASIPRTAGCDSRIPLRSNGYGADR